MEHEYPRIRGTGPLPCNLLGVGEAPGYWENKLGYPFAGKSGSLLDTYLLRNAIPRSRIRLTNLYPHWPGEGDPDPTQEQIAYGSRRLLREIGRVQPHYILAIGRISASWFYQTRRTLDRNARAGRHDRAFTLDVRHGLPFLWCPLAGPLGARGAWVIPSYHTAAALRDPETSGKCFYDIAQFALIARGELEPTEVVDVTPAREYKLSTALTGVLGGPSPAVDTEGFVDDPHCISYSSASGKAEVVYASNIKRDTPLPFGVDRITFHHAMADLPVLAAMGFKVDDARFDDTILMARLLLLEPPGLKELALRHLGMEMREYNDVVGPYHRRAVLRYLRRAARHDWGPPTEIPVRDKKTGQWRIYRPHSVGQRIAGILRDVDAGKRPKLAERWGKIDPVLRAPVVARLGEIPRSHPRLAPEAELVPYACEDADATRRLRPKLWARIRALHLEEAYATDLGAIPMFSAMQQTGMQIDLDHFRRLRPVVAAQKESAGRKWLARWSPDRHMNLASGDQIADYIFNRLGERYGIRPLKWTPTRSRPKADESTLEILKDKHDSIAGLIAWKKLHTNLTFVDRIPKHVRLDGRIYPHINTQGTVTGRPSTADPNLLNIPVRTELGKKIRDAFVAPVDQLLLSVDLSQIELRLCAHLSGDHEMRRAFIRGEDLHDKTAKALGLDRYVAKITNFLILYGGTERRLRSELLEGGIDKSEAECAEIIRDWFRLFSGVEAWRRGLFAQARRDGFVRGMSGRIRYLPNLYLDDRSPLRAEAERHAGNHPIQEGNSYLTKRAMKRMWQWLKANPDEGIRPLLQIYDEILMEIPESKTEVAPVLRSLMLGDRAMLSVPVKADVEIGRRWGSMVKLEEWKEAA